MNTRILSVFRSDMDSNGRGYSHAKCKRMMEKPTAIFSQEGTKGMKTRDDRGAHFPLSVQVAQAQGRRERKKRGKKERESCPRFFFFFDGSADECLAEGSELPESMSREF